MYILWLMLIFLIPYVVITVKGPTVWDRLLGMSLISSKVIIIIVMFSFITDIAYITDFAIIYALFGFISTFFITVYWVRHKERNE